MRSTRPGHRRFGPWAVLLLAMWAIGLMQSVQMTRANTDHADIFADVEQYGGLREILGDASLAAFRTDRASNRATSNRRWRFQYAAMPTILQSAFNDEAVFRMASNEITRSGSFHVVYEYRRRRSHLAFGRAVREYAESVGCHMTTFDPAPQVAVYRLHGCRHG